METTGLPKNIEAFIRDRKAQNLSKGTIEWYECKLNKFLQFCISEGVYNLLDIRVDTLRSFVLYLRSTGHNDGGVHGHYRAVRAFLYFAENEYEPDNWKNPIRKIKAPRVEEEPIEGVSLEEYDKLYNTCDSQTFYGERNKAILCTLMDTGVRANELLCINIQDVDLTDSSILIRQGKGRKPRYVFIGAKTRRQLRRYLKLKDHNNHALFTTAAGDRLTYSGLREIIRRLSKQVGISSPGLHDFRRAFALEQIRNRVDLISISRVMGQTTTKVLSRYLRQTKIDLYNAYRSVLDNR